MSDTHLTSGCAPVHRVVGGMGGLIASPSERQGGWAAMMRDPTAADGSILTGHALLGTTGSGAALHLCGLKAAVVSASPAAAASDSASGKNIPFDRLSAVPTCARG